MEVVVVGVLVEAEEAVAVGHGVDEAVDLREEEEEMAEEEVLVEEAFHRVVALRAVEVGEVEAGALRREEDGDGFNDKAVADLLLRITNCPNNPCGRPNIKVHFHVKLHFVVLLASRQLRSLQRVSYFLHD